MALKIKSPSEKAKTSDTLIKALDTLSKIPVQTTPKPKEKTVIIWMDCGVKFFIVEGDHSHLNQKFMDGKVTEQESEQIYNLLYEDVKTKKKRDMIKTFPVLAVVQGAKVIVTGLLP